jgi:hypothetical protein
LGGVPLAWFEHAAGDDVPVISVDSLNLTRCDFIKIDAEMMEQKVLLGARNTLTRLHPYIFLENEAVVRGDYDFHDRLLLQLDLYGYVCFWLHVPLFRPNNFFDNPVLIWNYPIGVFSHNMLCAHMNRPVVAVDLERVELSGRTSLSHAQIAAELGLEDLLRTSE